MKPKLNHAHSSEFFILLSCDFSIWKIWNILRISWKDQDDYKLKNLHHSHHTLLALVAFKKTTAVSFISRILECTLSHSHVNARDIFRLWLNDNAMFYKTLIENNKEIIAHLRDKYFEWCIFKIFQHHQTFVNKSTETKRFCFTDIEINKCFIKHCVIV